MNALTEKLNKFTAEQAWLRKEIKQRDEHLQKLHEDIHQVCDLCVCFFGCRCSYMAYLFAMCFFHSFVVFAFDMCVIPDFFILNFEDFLILRHNSEVRQSRWLQVGGR